MERTTESLKGALGRAARANADSRVIVALITSNDTRWWGGSIADWHPDETRLSSRSALQRYRQLVHEFRLGRIPKAHAIMAYTDGSFASVMLGVDSSAQADELLKEVMEIARIRRAGSWLRA